MCLILFGISKTPAGIWEVAFGLLIGIPNFFSAKFLLAALKDIAAVIVYPVYSVATILAVTVTGVLVFREKLEKRQWMALGIILLALVLLLTGIVKDRHIDKASNFFVTNMSFFFVVPCVSVMDHFPKLVDCLLPFLFISVVTTPVVYCATAWSTQLLMALVDKKEAKHD